jgi:hypothetical protein
MSNAIDIYRKIWKWTYPRVSHMCQKLFKIAETTGL